MAHDQRMLPRECREAVSFSLWQRTISPAVAQDTILSATGM